MSGTDTYDWPPIEGLVALVREHGQAGAARLLGVSRTGLRDHLEKHGAVVRKAPKSPNVEALKEIDALLRS